MADREKKSKEIAFTGKWVSDIDPVAIGENFSVLTNLRYTDAGVRGVAGMTKINTTPLSPVLARSAYHYRKGTPSENHLLLQLGTTSGKVYSVESTIPGTSNTFTLLASESAGAQRGCFSSAPGGSVVYCNSVQTLIWGGDEQRISAVIEYAPDYSFWRDHTDVLRDNLATNAIAITGTDGGLDSVTNLLLHFDNNLTDDSLTTPHTVYNYGSNLLLNGSFEIAGAGAPDYFATWAETAGDGAIADSATSHVQSHAAKLTAGATKNTCITQTVTVAEETDYRLVFWTRGDATHDGQYGIYDDSNAADIVAKTATGVTAATYAEVVVDFTTPSGCTSVRIDLWCPDTAAGIAYFDWVNLFTIAGMVTFNATHKVFGTHAAAFDGAESCLVIEDDTDFDFSSSQFTIDLRVKLTTISGLSTLFFQATDTNNWIQLYIDGSGLIKLDKHTGGVTANILTSSSAVTTGVFYHIEIDRSSTAYTIFLNGKQVGSVTTATVPANYTGPVCIGAFYDGVTFQDALDGYLDEYRISGVERHTTTNFVIPLTAYVAVTAGYFYIGSTRPLDGIKFYVWIPNGSTSSILANYWNGYEWASCTSIVDGTNGLKVTGTLAFDSTVTTAKPSYYAGMFLYWYFVVVCETTNTEIYCVTLRSPMQDVVDIWDGTERTPTSALTCFSSVYSDCTFNILTNTYDSSDDSTFVDLSAMNNDTDVFYMGFSERMCGIHVFIPNGEGNTSASVYLKVFYWSGSTWIETSGLDDGTQTGYMTLNTSGVISWTAPADYLETTKTINNDVPMYYYKFSLAGSGSLSGGPQIFFATGIPAPITIKTYRFPLYAMDRLFLCNETCGYPNKILVSAANSDCVFNGDDSQELYIGDENPITGAIWLYSQFGSNLYNLVAFTKGNETWVLAGNGPEDWHLYRVSANVGCPAPMTMCTMNAPYELYQQSNRTISMWMGSNGIYIFDGKGFTPVHGDIEDWFDQRNDYAINTDVIENFVGFYDDKLLEYHWCFASGTSTTLNKEFVYDLRRRKWFEIDRGTGNYLQLGCGVMDTHGNTYCYGFGADGFIYRLENGTTFNGTGIAHEVVTGDMALGGSTWIITKVRNAKLNAISKTITANSIALQHWADGAATPTLFTMDAERIGYRITASKKSENITDAVFHRFGLSITTTDEPIGFEPIIFAVLYEIVREDTR